MGKTALILIATLIALPVLAYMFDQLPTAEQLVMIKKLGILMVAIALTCWIVGEITGNVSQTDKLWSITPVAYAWYAASLANWDARMVLMSVCATIWGVRLTYNFSRHGGYSWKFWTGAEDYRWAIVRKKPGFDNPVVWKVFHLGFICLYQHTLLLLIAIPVVLCAGKPLGLFDWILAAAYVGLVVFETIADQQQWNYQAQKKAGNKEARYVRGFIAEGLWSRARHPNYFAEQSIWVVFFLFSVAATGRFNWTVTGCVLLMALFQGSANLKESICAGKYPQYPDYVKRTPRFLPRLF